MMESAVPDALGAPIVVDESGFRVALQAAKVPGFLIHPEIFNFAVLLANEELKDRDSWGDCRIPLDSLRPATAILFGVPDDTDGSIRVYALDEVSRRENGDLETIVLELNQNGWFHMGNFTAGGSMFVNNKVVEVFDDTDCQHISGRILTLSFILSLINQPRIIRKYPLLSRQQRRAAHRGGNRVADAWHRVTWDLSKETVAKISHDPGFHKVALHWRRGHFRRAEEHYRGAMQRSDALRSEERDWWWQWIEGCWVGHPAYGVKLSVYAPRMSHGDIARRQAQ